MLKRFLPMLVLLFSLPVTLLAQVTTSSMGGSVKNTSGASLPGASVSATHVPTGRVYTAAVSSNGSFLIQNMNPGGPYTILVTFVGYQNGVENDVFLSLGERYTQNFVLSDKAGDLSAVVVSANRVTTQSKGGSETNIGRDKMTNLPSVGRNISDYLRYVPQAKVTGDGGISLAGQNNRYNSFYIDGAANNDMFGLAASGTNGGQTGAAPISIDAIDQMQVILSPYDVSLGNFTGGGINATTKSGTNEIHGSLYYFFRNQDLTGKTPGVADSLRTKIADFKNRTMGFSIGGPMIKNKAFFFVNAEMQKDEKPQPMLDTYQGASGDAGVQNLIAHLKSTYNYDPGDYKTNPDKLDAKRLATRFDFNLNDAHKLTLSYRYTNAIRNNVNRSSKNSINFMNGGYEFNSTTHSGSLELNSKFTNRLNNKLMVTGTVVKDFRDPNGNPFPRVVINDGPGNINFGTENFSAANALDQSTVALFDVMKWTKNKHTISLGTDNDINKASNIFIRDNYGTYSFSSVDAFINGDSAISYNRSYSLLDNGKYGRDAKNAAADFKTLRLSFFLMDEVRVSDAFSFTYGIRATNTKFLTTPKTDTFFNSVALPKLSNYYDLQGARSGLISDPAWSLDPRIGFVYKVAEEKATIRGGAGYFTGRIPLVWPGGVYNNNGISVGGTSNGKTKFIADPFNQYSASNFGQSNALPSGEINLISKDFKMNKVFRASLGVDKGFGKKWKLSMEGIATKNINEINYQRVDILPPTIKTTGADVRNIYPLSGSLPTKIGVTSTGSNPYSGVYLLSNNKEKKGYSFNFTTTIDKAWSNNWAFNANYSWGFSQVLNEGTSSQNSSQWRYMEAVNGRNFIGLSRSDFDPGHRINGYIAKKFSYAKDFLGTTISLVYNGQSGSPYSYTYGRGVIRDFDNNETNDLMFIPTDAQIDAMSFQDITSGSTVTVNAATQKQQLKTFLANDKYLSKHRGQYADRNGARLPFTHVVDFKLQQDFNVKMNGKKYQLQLTYDIFNFTNFLNKDWGKVYFISNDQALPLEVSSVSVAGNTATTKYKFYNPKDGRPYSISDGVFNSSRWTSQVGLRLNF